VSRGVKLAGILGSTVIAVVLIAFYVASFLASSPPTIAAPASPAGARLTMQTVASYGHEPHPGWVSYMVRDRSGAWRHSTVLEVPAHSVIQVTIYQYDTATGLRNPFWSQVRGTVGGTMTVDGKTMPALNPDDASHTFAIPELGVSVPLKGISDKAKNPCSAAPCSLANDHVTVTFTFRTAGRGIFRWQCFVPCAAKFVFGNGGPMQTIGWMDGLLRVV
jgi:hypothetical protein